tara:strand:- start:525 stop:788 length:264 start_codon:yes stop_codon:yes gene_type:complete
MKVKILLPTDATVSYDEANRQLTIEPFFIKPTGNQPFGFVTVAGDGGAEQRAMLQVSGRTGKPSCSAAKDRRVRTKFDALKQGSHIQ